MWRIRTIEQLIEEYLIWVVRTRSKWISGWIKGLFGLSYSRKLNSKAKAQSFTGRGQIKRAKNLWDSLLINLIKFWKKEFWGWISEIERRNSTRERKT